MIPPSSIFRRQASLCVFCLAFLSLFAVNAAGKVIDRVIAVVNNDVILQSDLETAMQPYLDKIKAKVPEDSQQEAIQKAEENMLQTLIDKDLIAQKAKKEKIGVSDQEIQRAYEMVRNRSGLTKEQFADKIKTSGMTDSQYKEGIRSQILQEKVINHDVRSKVVVTEAMIKDYYDSHNKEYTKTKDGYALLQIGFSWGGSLESQKSTPNMYADKIDAKRRAEEVRKLAEEGQDFRELAKKYSTLPSAADGGDIGVLQEEDMASDMRDAIVSLKPGQISKILETPAGFQFFKLLASKEGVDPDASYESAKEGIRQILYSRQLKKEFNTWVKKLTEESYIKKMYP